MCTYSVRNTSVRNTQQRLSSASSLYPTEVIRKAYSEHPGQNPQVPFLCPSGSCSCILYMLRGAAARRYETTCDTPLHTTPHRTTPRHATPRRTAPRRARRGEARRGEARQGKARRGEARRGEARPGQARPGHATQYRERQERNIQRDKET